MLVKVVSVNREDIPNKNGKGTYGKLTVAYRDDKGKLSEKSILSFTTPTVFKHFEKSNPGDEVNVKSEKVGDYWNWTAILADGDVSQSAPTSNTTSTATRVTGSNYETKEERAVKQRYIIKQSSLSAAVNVLTVGAKTPPSTEDILALADKFVDYVFDDNVNELALKTSVEDLEDDIPY